MTSRVVFDKNIDAFDEAQHDDKCPQKEMVHIRIQQRNGRKTLTTVQDWVESTN